MMGQFRNLVKQMSDDELHEAGIYLTQQLTKKEDFVEVNSNWKLKLVIKTLQTVTM